MATQVSSFMARWFGSQTFKYEAVHKKDDDISVELAQQWVSSHPLRGDLSSLTNQIIQSYAAQLIQDLRNIPINSSNITIIKAHLVKMSEQSERIKRLILQKLSSLDCDKTLISDVKFKLALVYTEKM